MTAMFDGYMSSYGLSQTYLNGEKVEDIAYDADYNGKTANIAARNGNDMIYMKLNNNELLSLLNANNASKKGIHERLIHDFSKTKHSKSKKKRGKRKSKTRKGSLTKSKTKSRIKSRVSRTKKHRKSIPAIDREIIY